MCAGSTGCCVFCCCFFYRNTSNVARDRLRNRGVYRQTSYEMLRLGRICYSDAERRLQDYLEDNRSYPETDTRKCMMSGKYFGNENCYFYREKVVGIILGSVEVISYFAT